MSQYLLDLFVGKSSLVIGYHRYFPGLQPTLQTLILPVNLRVICQALELTTSRVGAGRCLAAHEAIAHDFVTCQGRGPPPSRCP